MPTIGCTAIEARDSRRPTGRATARLGPRRPTAIGLGRRISLSIRCILFTRFTWHRSRITGTLRGECRWLERRGSDGNPLEPFFCSLPGTTVELTQNGSSGESPLLLSWRHLCQDVLRHVNVEELP